MNRRRFLAIIMSVFMILSLLPVSVFAETTAVTLDGQLKIQGTVAAGTTLKADMQGIKNEGITEDSVSYQWFRKTSDDEKKEQQGEDLMQMFFWLEEENKAAIHVFKIETGRRDENEPKQYALSLGSNDAQSPFIGIRFSYGQMEAYLNEWMVWRECLANGQITEQEYLDWKWNWHI